MALRTLTELELRILDFAEKHDTTTLRNVGMWEKLHAEFGWRPVAYIQRLYWLIDDPAAERERPLLVHRLRRMRDERRAARAERRFANLG